MWIKGQAPKVGKEEMLEKIIDIVIEVENYAPKSKLGMHSCAEEFGYMILQELCRAGYVDTVKVEAEQLKMEM